MSASSSVLNSKSVDINNLPHSPATTAINDMSTENPEIPVWLSKAYLETHLRVYYKDKHLKVQNLDAKPALGKGENYGGVLIRVKAEFITRNGVSQTGYYIIKTNFENEFARQMMAPYDVFNREMCIYETVLPKLNALLKEIGDDEQIFAETLAVDYERSALIFEDLTARGFVMPDRIKGLDIQLTKIVLRKLAKMHATSAILNERENGALESYDRGMFNRHTDNYTPFFIGILEACTRCVDQWPGYEAYSKKMVDLKSMYMELGKRVFDAVKGQLNVLAHGDLWTNNVMVKYDRSTGEPIDVIIIDLQYSSWGSPAIDLFYFLNTSLKEDLHLHQQDELIQFYYYILADNLRKLAYKAHLPSLHKFHLQLQEKSFYAFNSTCLVQPVQRNEETEDADILSLMKNDERGIRFKNGCYKNAYCQKIIKKLLPIYDRKGLLDFDQ